MTEKITQNKIISKINTFIEGYGFPFAVAGVAFISHCFALDGVGFMLLALAVAYINICCNTTRPIIPVALMAATAASAGGEYRTGVSAFIVVALVISAILVVGSILTRITVQKKWREIFKLRSLTIGFVAFAVALLLAGVFSSYFTLDSLIISLTMVATGIVIYSYMSVTIEKKEDNLLYFARCTAITIVQIVMQLGVHYLLNYEYGMALDDGWKGGIVLGWGISNPIGEYIAFLFPMVMYLMYKEKHGWIYYVVAIIALVGVYFTLSRCALLISLPVFGIGVIVNCIKSQNRKLYWIITGVLVVGAILVCALSLTVERLQNLIAFFAQAKLSDRGRFDLWKKFLNLFSDGPIFGTGFSAYQIISGKASVFDCLAHNTIVQIISSTGVVGTVCYIFHRFETIKLFAKSENKSNFIYALCIICYIVMGMLDPVTFYANFAVVYTIMLALAEKTDEKSEKAEVKSDEKGAEENEKA